MAEGIIQEFDRPFPYLHFPVQEFSFWKPFLAMFHEIEKIAHVSQPCFDPSVRDSFYLLDHIASFRSSEFFRQFRKVQFWIRDKILFPFYHVADVLWRRVHVFVYRTAMLRCRFRFGFSSGDTRFHQFPTFPILKSPVFERFRLLS